MPRVACLIALGIAASACGPGLPAVTAADAERGHVQLADLQRGRTLLVQRCGGCHATPHPSDEPQGTWPRKLVEMSERAHLDLTERGLIEDYLVTMASTSPR